METTTYGKSRVAVASLEEFRGMYPRFTALVERGAELRGYPMKEEVRWGLDSPFGVALPRMEKDLEVASLEELEHLADGGWTGPMWAPPQFLAEIDDWLAEIEGGIIAGTFYHWPPAD